MAVRDGVAPRRSRGAVSVAAGILTSRLAGLVRAAATSAAFGVGPYADVFQTALRAPNVLQNLLGEQALSASFIPVYSRLLARGDEAGARRLAGAVFGLLTAAAAGLALLGVLAARPIVAMFATGYLGDAAQIAAGTLAVDRFELAVRAVRWIFPMTGFLVLSAWALGVLNSHRRFFLPYVAPVAWNAAIVTALVFAARGRLGGAGEGGERLLFAACAGALAGGFLQLAIQLPGALRAVGGLRWSLSTRVEGVRATLSAFGPAVAGRGVVQISSYLDQILASLLAVGAVSALGYGQMLYLLPISLFGQSIAAAALPDLARGGETGGIDVLRQRSRRALATASFLSLPAAIGYLLFARVAVGGLYRLLPGRFGMDDELLVASVLSVYALGLVASASSRVLQTTFFALGDTRTPARIAALRVGVGTALAVPAMMLLDRFGVTSLPGGEALESSLRLGAVGLALGASAGALSERLVLGRALRQRLPMFAPARRVTLGRAGLALAAALPAAGVAVLLATVHPTLRALGVFATLAGVYLALAFVLRLPEARSLASLRGRR